MQQMIILTEEQLVGAIRNAVESSLEDLLPEIFRKAIKKPWMNVNEVSEYTGLSKNQIYYLTRTEKISFYKEKRTIVIETDSLDKYLKENLIRPYN